MPVAAQIWQCLYYAMVSPLIVKQWMIVPKGASALLAVDVAAFPARANSRGVQC